MRNAKRIAWECGLVFVVMAAMLWVPDSDNDVVSVGDYEGTPVIVDFATGTVDGVSLNRSVSEITEIAGEHRVKLRTEIRLGEPHQYSRSLPCDHRTRLYHEGRGPSVC